MPLGSAHQLTIPNFLSKVTCQPLAANFVSLIVTRFLDR
jgi:hypothetical protein